MLSENKTLQGIYAQQVYPQGEGASRRAMHSAVFEAGWSSEKLMTQHRQIVGQKHRGVGREIISLDWTLSYHEYGLEIYGVKRSYDYVNRCMSNYQTVVTATIANPERIDGIAAQVQLPDFSKEEKKYLQMTAQESYHDREQLMQRLTELLHYQQNRLAYRMSVRCRNGEVKQFWAFTKTVRLKRYGRKRLIVVHEREDLSDEPRFLLTDALHWESGRVIQTWSYRWTIEIFHEFGKQVTGFESARGDATRKRLNATSVLVAYRSLCFNLSLVRVKHLNDLCLLTTSKRSDNDFMV